jgi:hypothetical protein
VIGLPGQVVRLGLPRTERDAAAPVGEKEMKKSINWIPPQRQQKFAWP